MDEPFLEPRAPGPPPPRAAAAESKSIALSPATRAELFAGAAGASLLAAIVFRALGWKRAETVASFALPAAMIAALVEVMRMRTRRAPPR